MRAVLFSLVLVAGCATTDSKGSEEDAPIDGKADSFAHPTDHGAIAFATAQTASLKGSAEYHTWTFSLSGNASIHTFTSRVPHYATPDTVLYLYKKTTTGTWGSYIARNDDSGNSDLSSITKALGAGDYRVLVKGHDASVKGPFGIEVDCDGAGCAAPSTCLFGTFQDDFLNGTNPNLIANKTSYTLAQYQALGPNPVMDQRIIAALHESAHTDVVTVADAFAAADANEIDLVRIYDLLGARAFVAVEYGAGDNPYGAIFTDGTAATEVAALHDSDIDSCTVSTQTCELHQNFYDLRQDASWVRTSQRTVTMASQLTGNQAANALAAIRVAYADAATLTAGLADIDQGELDVSVFTKGATSVEAYDYGAGDNTYGALYLAGTTTVAAEIHDGDFYGCTLLQ